MSGDLESEQRWHVLLRYSDRLLRIARPMCVSEQDAEDCVHEALLQAARHPRLDPERASGLLAVIATRRAQDLARRRACEQRAVSRLLSSELVRVAPDDLATDLLLARGLAARARALPRREREVLALRVAGATASETARSLGITARAADSAFTRARRALKGAAAR